MSESTEHPCYKRRQENTQITDEHECNEDQYVHYKGCLLLDLRVDHVLAVWTFDALSSSCLKPQNGSLLLLQFLHHHASFSDHQHDLLWAHKCLWIYITTLRLHLCKDNLLCNLLSYLLLNLSLVLLDLAVHLVC